MIDKNMKKDFRLYARSMGISSTTMDSYENQVDKKMGGGMGFKASMTPSIVEERYLNVAVMDVFSRLLMNRIIFLGLPIDEYVSNIISAQMLYLNSISDSNEDINMYINSPGGSVYDGNAILDVMDFVQCDVGTLCTGLAASMSAVILSHGTKGKRDALKRSRVMIHQPLGGTGYSQASDIEITAREIGKIKKELSEQLAENSGQDYEKVLKDCDRDFWMTSAEAKDYGLIDNVIQRQNR